MRIHPRRGIGGGKQNIIPDPGIGSGSNQPSAMRTVLEGVEADLRPYKLLSLNPGIHRYHLVMD
jgi:hypothetical protein